MSLAFTSFAEYKYELVEQNGHRVHVTTLDPAEYYISFVSAHNQVFGRERVGDIAERENAQIAINAGFFQIADIEDGRPTDTALNDAEIFGIRTTKHGCLVKKEGKLAIEIITPSLEVIVNSNTIKPLRFNRFAKGRNIFYFAHSTMKCNYKSSGHLFECLYRSLKVEYFSRSVIQQIFNSSNILV